MLRPEPSPLTAEFERDVFRTAPPELIPHGRDAYIIGTGPSLTEEVLARIPQGAWVAVLNKALIDAIEMGLRPSCIKAWFCATPEYKRNADWWEKANALAWLHGIPRVFSWQLDAQGVECEYTFYTQPSFGDPLAPDGLVPGVLRSGGTIAGITEQWPALCKARRIILVAIDMFGDLYCDGSKSIRANKKNQEWPEMGVLARTTRACQAAGIPVATLTPTALSNHVEIENLTR